VDELEEGPTESEVRLAGAPGTTKIEFRLEGGRVVTSVEEQDTSEDHDASSHAGD
jgi:hypothetical protein